MSAPAPLQGKPYVAGSLDPYKIEIFFQCYAATGAWNRAYEALTSTPRPTPQDFLIAGITAVSEIQAFLVSAGILSDIFFPDSQGDQARRQALCSLFGVNKTWKLADTKLRNSFVHIDARLDKWLPSQVGQVIGPLAIMPWNGPAPPKGTGPFHRIIDNSASWRILIHGQELELQPLLIEIDKIGQKFPLEFDSPNGPVRLAMGPATTPSKSVKVVYP